MSKFLTLAMAGLFATQLSMCTNSSSSTRSKGNSAPAARNAPTSAPAARKARDITPAWKPKIASKYAVATFAGGCFWCMQPPFDKLKGVIRTSVGYTGGIKKNPTYKEVAYGRTKHTEAIQVIYDPKVVSYAKLVYVFWRNINPTQKNGQFADRGTQYRTGIFWHDEAQRKVAQASKQKLASSGKFKDPIAVEITKASPFYHAEAYHQKYYEKNPGHYNRYRVGSGRAGYLKRVWGAKK